MRAPVRGAPLLRMDRGRVGNGRGRAMRGEMAGGEVGRGNCRESAGGAHRVDYTTCGAEGGPQTHKA